MAETRKQPQVGEIYGDWTIIAKVPGKGDRLRRWLVRNSEGTEMESLQTGLSDLALAKRLANQAAATDAARIPVLAQDDSNVFENAFTLTEAEVDLYRRLDNQIAEAQNPLDSLVLANDFFPENPFADLGEGHCVDCDEGNHPDLPGPLEHQIQQIEAQMSSRLPDGLTVQFDRTPLVPSVMPDYRAKLISAMDNIVKARIALNAADMAIQELL